MNKHRSWVMVLVALVAVQAGAQILAADVLKKIVPASYFFAGQSAPVQARNSVGLKTAAGKFVLAGLVDTSGYSTAIQEKYQGFLITEVKLAIEGSELTPGEYGFGFSKQAKFTVMDIGNNDLVSVSAHLDESLHRPVPLRIVADQSTYKLYAGRKWVSLKAQ